MKHIVGVVVMFVTLTACGELAAAQQPAKNPRIGFLFVGSKDQPHLESFHQGLRELGYVEGKNISIEYRYAEGKSDVLPVLAAELVALNVELIVTTNPNGSRAVLRASSAIPMSLSDSILSPPA
jgi:putative tryptophan/tyrosine transport system substrate-binding protein